MVASFNRWSPFLACVILACAWSIPARANPQGGVVAAGAATITESGSRLDVHQVSDRTVIDWRGFDIAPSETTQFHQPSSSALAVNRVNSMSASHIDGTLTANGNIVIINQNGVVFGRGSRVDANSLVATSADTANADVMAGGKLHFTKPGNPNAQVVNQGTITAKDAGLVGLVAPTVINDGVITANLGRAHLASGDTATVDLYGDGLLEVAVSDQVHQQLVSNTGHITANGGKIALTAAAGKAIVNGVVHVGGTLTAQTVATRNGEIIIASAGSNHTNKQGNSEVMLAGAVDVSGRRNGEKGGKINITGDHVALASTASLIAAGQNGGGSIHVGGEYQGRGSLPNAKTTNIEHGAIIDASSIGYGNGGQVIVWSDNGTSYDGHIDVSASAAGGNGGFIEVSGKDWLRFAGTIDASAPAGQMGSLLLDPADITISNAADSNITGSTPFQSTGAAASNLNVTTLETALGLANVTITSAAGVGGLGDITFLDPVLWNSANSLTVTASNNIIVNSTITNAGSGSVTLNANVAATGDITINSDITTGGSITMLAKRDIIQAGSTTLTTGAAGSVSLRAANALTAGAGNLTLNGNLSVGNGGLTLLSGANGTRPSYTATTTNLVPQTGTFGAVSITGFQDLTIARDLASNGAITLTAMRDLTLNAACTITNGVGAAMALSAANGSTAGTGNLVLNGILAPSTGTLTLVSGANGTRPSFTATAANIIPQGATVGAINIQGFQDFTINTDLTSSSTILIYAMRDLTLSAARTVTSGAAGSIDLRAANGVVAGTGNLNINGNLSSGSAGVTLRSGINGTRPSLTLDATNFFRQGATFGVLDIQGLFDLTINRDIASSGAITMLAYRDLTLNATNSIASGAGSALSLQAAGGSTAGTGNLVLNGTISTGTGNLTLLSGINGTRPSITFDATKLIRLGATFGAVSITGYNDLTIDRDINSSGNITLTSFRDLTLNAARTLTTGAAGAFNLQAANGVVAGTGNLTLNGNLSAGSGAVTMRSGINGTRPSWTMDTTTFVQQGATVGAVDIQGFQDMTINRNLTSNGAITVVTQRDLTVSAARTVRTAAGSALNLSAANALIAGTGNLTLLGDLASGTGALTLISGVNGTRPSWTADATTLNRLGATFGIINIQGFQDLTISRNMNSSGNVTMLANRDLTLSAATTITTGAASNLSLRAANAVVTGTGNLTLSGNLAPGTGTVTLYSGVNGTRPNWTMDATTFAMLGATVSTLDVQGFLDLTVDRNITSSGAITMLAYRDLNLNALRTLRNGAATAMSLRAAGGSTAGTGKLNLNGILNAGTGALTLLSGTNGGRPTWTADATSLVRLGATFGAINWQGFANIIIDRPLNSSSTISFTNNTLTTLSDDLSSTGTMTFGAATVIDQGVTANLTSTGAMTFSTTLNGTAGGAAENLVINSGTAITTFTGIVGGTAPLGNLSVAADNITISANLNGTGTLMLAPNTAGRAINTGTAATDASTTAGFNLSNAETGRLVNGWSSITIGSLTSGDFTNSRAAWSDPVNFLSGNDFINSTAIASADPIFVQAVRDVTINQNIATTNTSATAVVLVAGRNLVNTKGAGSVTTGAGGRWLIYSTDPTGSTGEQLLSNAFNRYTCTYGGSCPILGAGNGFLYSYTPTITVSISGQTYTYGDAVLPPGGYILVTSDYLNALDSAQGSITGVGNFATTYVQGDHAGTSYTIVDNGSTLANNIGYGFTISTPTGTVQQRAITITTADQSHIYGFGGLGTAGYSITAGSLYGADAISGVTLATNATLSSSGEYNYSPTPWTLDATATSFSTGLVGDYAITYVSAPTGLTIAQRALNVTATGINKVYDGLIAATVNYGDDRVAGDVFTVAGTANFTDKNVANGKTINVTGIGISGADTGNYTYNATTTTTADITPRALTVTANNKAMTYGAGNTFNGFTPTGLQNGETIGSVTLSTDATSSTSGNWNYNAAPWTITASAATGGTFDINNYTVTYVTGTLTIAQRALAVTATGVNKVYDGLAGATVNYGDDRVAGDVFTVAGTANFTDKNVANGKTINVTGIGISGADTGNYTYNATTTTTADITPRALTVTANNKAMTYGAGNTFNGFTPTGLQNGETIGSVILSTNATTSGSGNWNAHSTPWTITTSAATGGTFDINNYTVTYNTGTLTIAQRALSLGSITAADKPYDGSTAASLTGYSFNGAAIVGDVISVTGLGGTFNGALPGVHSATATTGTLAGADAANYSFTRGPVVGFATITPSALVPPAPPPVLVIPGTVAHVSQGAISEETLMAGLNVGYTLTYIGPPALAANILHPVGVGRAFFYVPTAELFDYDKPEDNNFSLPYLEEADI